MYHIKAQFTDFGLKVKQELAKKRLSQAWLAEQIGISDSYLTAILQGCSCPDERIEDIKRVLRV